MKVLQIFIGLVVAAFIIFTVVVGFSVGNVDSIVKQSIESTNSELTQVNFMVQNVEIDLKNGKGALHTMQLANPLGFSDELLLSDGKIDITLDVSSAKKRVKVIKQLDVSQLAIRHEINGQGESSIEQLLNNIAQPHLEHAVQEQVTELPKKPVFLMIETLNVAPTNVTIVTGSDSRTVTMPAYTETNIGATDAGLSPEQLAKALFDSVLIRAISTN